MLATQLHEAQRHLANPYHQDQHRFTPTGGPADGRADDMGADGNGNATDADADLGGANSFVPPVDVFNTADNWTVHVALPGAKKEDVALNWDAKKGQLAITGMVHRPGDEPFLAGMVLGERRVGLFERRVTLPPAESGDKDDVDGQGIKARLGDGVLVVVVPKAEKEWTEVRKVDIL
ncbi:hypothetical protein P8C59_003629 [Phyllachora maydis]|nr:hypothetical protein P8C59_003629 [Phyllachora maydis]